MKNILLSFFFLSGLISQAQDVKLNYSKGSSLLFFDLDTKTEKLSNRIGLSLGNDKYEFQMGYSTFNYSYDGDFLNAADLYKNYKSDIQSVYLSYGHAFANFNRLKFNLGLELAFSNFSIFTNLQNNQGLKYSDFSPGEWRELGYYSESNYETNLSELNLDRLADYNLNYLNFGPSIECIFELVENFEISLKSIYRKNTIDLLDNIDVNNLRNISSTTATDNQIDLMLGLKFCLNNRKSIDNDSLVSLIDSITNADTITEQEEVLEKPIDKQVVVTTDESYEIKDNQAYILGYFDFDPNSVNAVEDQQLSDYNSEPFIEDTYSDSVSNQSVEPEYNTNYNFVESDSTFYLIVGVFSDQSNLDSFAKSLDIDPSNSLFRNELNYLYLLKSNSVQEVRQLRDNLEYDSWILTIF